jgi:hypothetical protein
MKIGKESAPKNEKHEEQGNLDFRSEEEKDRALIDRVLEEKISTGTFSPGSLSKEDLERYLRLIEKESKEDKDYHGH